MSSAQTEEWRAKLLEALEHDGAHIPCFDAEQLSAFLEDNRDVIGLNPGEHSDTSIVTMEIDTEDATPIKQAPQIMQLKRVIWLSNSL